MAKAEDQGANPDGDRSMSKASIDAAVQAAFELCATCSHERGEHGPDDGPCPKSWETRDNTGRVTGEQHCTCKEFWPVRDDREDGRRVVEYGVVFGGGLTLELDRRVTSELWDALKLESGMNLRVRVRVSAKGLAPKKEDGFVIGLKATRKLTVEGMELVDADGEVFGV